MATPLLSVAGFVQQDAEECWSTLVTALSQKLLLSVDDGPTDLPAGEPPVLPRMQALKKTVGDMLFGVEMESTYSCLEGDGIEPAVTKREAVRKIACHISEKTAHLYTALEVNLDEVVEKNVMTTPRPSPHTTPEPLGPSHMRPLALTPATLWSLGE